MHRNIKDNITGYSFLLPSIIILIFIYGLQIIRLFWFSIIKWEGYISKNTFNNFDYYKSIFSEGDLSRALMKTLLIVAIVIPLVIIITTFIVHNFYRKIKFSRFYKGVIFISSILPIVVVSSVWSFLLHISGPLNTILQKINLNFLVVDWFGNSKFAIITLCWVIIWRELGYSTIIFSAALESTDKSIYEAAMLDGANEFQLIRHVTFPSLNPIIKLYIVTLTIFIINNLFGIILVTTNGGPGYATTVLEYYIYYLTFRLGKIGLGAAVAVILFIITLLLILIYMRINSKGKKESIF